MQFFFFILFFASFASGMENRVLLANVAKDEMGLDSDQCEQLLNAVAVLDQENALLEYFINLKENGSDRYILNWLRERAEQEVVLPKRMHLLGHSMAITGALLIYRERHPQ